MSDIQQSLLAVGQGQLTKDDYYTPKAVFDALGLTFDLDVCAPPGGVPWVPARRYFTLADDGLSQPWEGRVWMNPPYSAATLWAKRFIEHGNGVALVGHAKSAWHPKLWAAADAVAFGMWGGLSPRARSKILRERGESPLRARQRINHGLSW